MICAFASRSISISCSGRDRLVVAEVEAEPVGRDQRARLLHVRAEHLAQRPVQDVRGGVVAADPVAAHAVDRGGDVVAFDDRAAADHRVVHDERAGKPVGRVDDVEFGAARRSVIVPVSPTWPPDSA